MGHYRKMRIKGDEQDGTRQWRGGESSKDRRALIRKDGALTPQVRKKLSFKAAP